MPLINCIWEQNIAFTIKTTGNPEPWHWQHLLLLFMVALEYLGYTYSMLNDRSLLALVQQWWSRLLDLFVKKRHFKQHLINSRPWSSSLSWSSATDFTLNIFINVFICKGRIESPIVLLYFSVYSDRVKGERETDRGESAQIVPWQGYSSLQGRGIWTWLKSNLLHRFPFLPPSVLTVHCKDSPQ